MMRIECPPPHRRLFAALMLVACAASWADPPANAFPTSDRVVYVEDCMHAHPGPYFEMVNKCSCAIDAIAGEVSFDDYTAMQTAINGVSINGERGNDFRDNKNVQTDIKRFKTLQRKVEKACFIDVPSPK